MGLTGKTAIVTGGGTGFGAGIARALAAAGARVMIGDADPDAAEAVARDCGGLWVALDPALNASVGAMGYKAADVLGDLDILVNAALPPASVGLMHEMSETGFDALLLATATSVHLTTQHFVPAMQARRSGVILQVLRRTPAQSIWADAANAWTAGLTRSMAAELGPQGIRVNALSVLADTAPALPRFLGGKNNDDRARHLSTIPLGRYGLPDDLAQAAVFLCSEGASLITGLVMDIDGGARL